MGVATICTCCTLPLGAGATVAGELNGYIESYGYTQHMVGFLDPMMGRLPMLIIAIVYFSFFALRFSPDEPILPTSLETKNKRSCTAEYFSEMAAIVIFFGDAIALMFAKSWAFKIGKFAWRGLF